MSLVSKDIIFTIGKILLYDLDVDSFRDLCLTCRSFNKWLKVLKKPAKRMLRKMLFDVKKDFFIIYDIPHPPKEMQFYILEKFKYDLKVCQIAFPSTFRDISEETFQLIEERNNSNESYCIIC